MGTWEDVGVAEEPDPVTDAKEADCDPEKEADCDPDADTPSRGTARGCRLCSVQSEAPSERVSQFNAGSKNTSKAAGCVR